MFLLIIICSIRCTYPGKILHVVDGWVTDTAALIEVVEGGGITHLELCLFLGRGASQHGVEDVEVSLHWVLTHHTVLFQ